MGPPPLPGSENPFQEGIVPNIQPEPALLQLRPFPGPVIPGAGLSLWICWSKPVPGLLVQCVSIPWHSSAPPRSSQGGKLQDAFCKQSPGRAEQVCKLLPGSVLELQLQKTQELLAHCMSFLEAAARRTQKMDFNLDKPRRKPLTWLLKCLGANFD